MKVINQIKTGQRIKELAVMHGYTASSLSSKLFVSEETVFKWYSGVNVPRIDVLILMSELFGVLIDEIIVRDEVA